MFKSSAKKVMAVLLSVTLLLSCMVFYGTNAGAANVTVMEADYESPISNYKEADGATDNIYMPGAKALMRTVEGKGHNGSNGYMSLFFEGNTTDYAAGFRLFGNKHDETAIPSSKGVGGNSYNVSFYYKVVKAPVDTDLYFGYGSLNWAGKDTSNGGLLPNTLKTRANVVKKTLTATDTEGEWQYFETGFFTAANQNGFHVGLISSDNSKRDGTNVLIDDMKIETAEVFSIKFDTRGGSAISDIKGTAGSNIVWPTATPIKGGFIFDGWEMEDGSAVPETFPESSLTVYAKWKDPSVLVMKNGFDSVASATFYGTSGNASADAKQISDADGANNTKGVMKIDAKSALNGFVISSEDGTPLNVELGKLYRLNFRYRVEALPDGASGKLQLRNGNWATGAATDVIKINGTTEWTDASVYFNPTEAGSLSFALQMGKLYDGTVLYIDELEVADVDQSYLVTITFDTDGGSAVAPISGMPGIAITFPASPTKEGCEFRGWKQGSNTYTGTTFPASSITLKADWLDISKMVSVTLNTLGGNDLDPVRGNKGAIFSAPTPTKAGYTFAGWYQDHACTTAMTVFPEENNRVAYAGWLKEGSYIQDYEQVGASNETLLVSNFEPIDDKNTEAMAAAVAEKRNDGQLPFYYKKEVNGNNSWTVDGCGAYAQYIPDYGEGAHDGTGVMSLHFDTENTKNVAAFSLCALDKAGTYKIMEKTMLNVGFWYKAEKVTADTKLKVISTSCNLGGDKDNIPGVEDNCTKNNITPAVEIAADLTKDDTGSDWKYAVVAITTAVYNSNGTGLYIVLDCGDAARKDTVVLIDDITVSKGGYTATTAYPVGNKNGDASTQFNHTSGGLKSVTITNFRNTSGTKIPRIVYANAAGDKALATGKTYIATFWMLCTIKLDANVNLFNEGDLSDFTQSKIIDSQVYTLNANTWVRVQKIFTLNALNGEKEDYVSIGLTATKGATIWVDDVSIEEYTPDYSLPQDFEEFTAGTPADLNGTETAREVVAGTNNTVGGNQSLKMNLSTTTATHIPYVSKFGDYLSTATENGYMIKFYAYTAADVDVNFSIGSVGGDAKKADLTATGNIKKVEGDSQQTVSLKGGEWTRVYLIANSITGVGNALYYYLGLNAWLDNSSAVIYLDDIQVTEYTEPLISSEVLCFESYKIGDDPSLNGSMEVAIGTNHTSGGMRSAMVTGDTTALGTRPQMVLTDGALEPLEVEAGNSYQLIYYVYLPNDAPTDQYRFWITVDGADTLDKVYTSAAQVKEKKVYEAGVGIGNEAGDITLTKGAWTKVVCVIEDTPFSGTLRMGACLAIDEEQSYTFYLDDFQMRDYVIPVYDPNAKIQDFENFNFGDNDMIVNRPDMGQISDEQNHTENGQFALQLDTIGWAGIDRNQVLFINPANGQPLELTMGESYVVSFWVYIPEDQAAMMSLNYWMCCTNKPGKVNDKSTAEFDIGGNGNNISVEAGEWYYVQQLITVKNGKYLVLGISDNTTMNSGTTYFIDDLYVGPPSYITMKYDTDGAVDADGNPVKYETTKAVVGNEFRNYLPTDDLYKEGFEFEGWSTKKGDLGYVVEATDTIPEGDEITLYAIFVEEGTGTKKKKEKKDDEEKEPTTKIVIEEEVTYEKVYTGEADKRGTWIEGGERPELEIADAVKKDDKKPVDKVTDEGMPTWLIIVIIAAAVVVVGGGAALVLLLLKKNKKKA